MRTQYAGRAVLNIELRTMIERTSEGDRNS